MLFIGTLAKAQNVTGVMLDQTLAEMGAAIWESGIWNGNKSSLEIIKSSKDAPALGPLLEASGFRLEGHLEPCWTWWSK